jgi:hypothetical protein
MSISLIGLLVVLLVAIVVLWAARTLINVSGIGQPIATVIYVLIVLIVLLWVIGDLGVVAVPHVVVR